MAAVAVKVGHLVNDRILRREQAESETEGNSPGTTPPDAFTATPMQTPGATSGADVKLARLRQLGELRDSGVLTPEEFEKQKSILLGG